MIREDGWKVLLSRLKCSHELTEHQATCTFSICAKLSLYPPSWTEERLWESAGPKFGMSVVKRPERSIDRPNLIIEGYQTSFQRSLLNCRCLLYLGGQNKVMLIPETEDPRIVATQASLCSPFSQHLKSIQCPFLGRVPHISEQYSENWVVQKLGSWILVA